MKSFALFIVLSVAGDNRDCPDEGLAGVIHHDGFRYTKEHPIVFIGGYPRSGTTLMRVLVEMNEAVRCGPETHIIPRMLSRWDMTRGSKRMNDTGITPDLYDLVSSDFILNIIARHDHGAKVLCNKDPFTLRYMETLTRPKMFPNAKFILMLRDPRAIANSMRSRKITIANVDNDKLQSIFNSWNRNMNLMYTTCLRKEWRDMRDDEKNGKNCLVIRYEDLVEHTEHYMRKVMKFIGEDFTPEMLNHTTHMKGVTLAPNEPSTSQVSKPIYRTSLYEWIKNLNMTSADYSIVKALKSLENMETWKILKKRYPGYRRIIPGYNMRTFRAHARPAATGGRDTIQT